MVVKEPRSPSGIATHGPSYALMRARYIVTTSVDVIWCLRIADWMSSIVASSIWNFDGFGAADRDEGRIAATATAIAATFRIVMGTPVRTKTCHPRRSLGPLW